LDQAVKQPPLLIAPRDLDRLHGEGHVTMADYVDAVETAFIGQARDELTMMPRQVLWRDPSDTGVRSPSLKLSASVLRTNDAMGATVYSAHFRPGDLSMWIMLFSAQTGELQAILHGAELSWWKTGATGALGAKMMARADASRVGLVGAGYFARSQLLGLASVRDIRTVRYYTRSADRRAAFGEWARAHLPGATIEAATSARDAVEDCDIAVTMTTSPQVVVEGAWLPEGVHCNVMGQHDPRAREVDSAAVLRCRVVVDSLAQAWNEKGELLIPLEEGTIARDHVLGELGDVAAGTVIARRDSADRTMFCSGGTSIEYMATCAMLHRKARAAGVGQEFAT
jgi:ornithine cyclodeaminase/alanine dehydrogenase-like protein (mu-crystallin family)